MTLQATQTIRMASNNRNAIKYNPSILVAILLDILFFIAAICNSVFISIIAIILLLLLGITVKKINALWIGFFLLPSQAIVGIIGFPVGLIGLYFILVLLTSYKQPGMAKKYLLFAFTLTCICLFHSINLRTIYDFAIAVQIILVIFLFCGSRRKFLPGDQIQLVNAFLFGTLILGINGLIYQLVQGEGLFVRLQGVLDNANYIAVTFSFAAAVSFIRYLKFGKTSNLLLLALYIAFMLLTGSRGALLSFLVSAILFYIISFRTNKRYISILFFAIIAVCCVLFLPISFMENIRVNLIQRTLDGLLNPSHGAYTDVSSGRIYLWKNYWRFFGADVTSTLVGYGISDCAYRLTGQTMWVHNVFISSLLNIGILGFVSLLVLYYGLCKYLSTFHKQKLQFFSLILSFLVAYVFLDGMFDIRLIFYFVISCFLFNNIADKKSRTIKC